MGPFEFPGHVRETRSLMGNSSKNNREPVCNPNKAPLDGSVLVG